MPMDKFEISEITSQNNPETQYDYVALGSSDQESRKAMPIG
jgi:hypothetical protein